MSRKLLIVCGALSAVGVLGAILLLIAVVVSSNEGTDTAGSANLPDSPIEEPEQGADSSAEYTRDNFAELVAAPDANQGAKVDIVGQIFQPPDIQDGEPFFQIWADPKNAEWNTLVFADEEMMRQLNSDDYVRVRGTVRGALEGENMFGGTLDTLGVDADSVKVVEDPAAALDPARATVNVGQTRKDKGFSITLEKVEFGEETTRAYVKARNGTNETASLFTYDARIVQGSKQIDPNQSFEYSESEPQSDLEPGVETEGVLTFGPADPSTPFRLRVEWYSENYNLDPEPLKFEVTP